MHHKKNKMKKYKYIIVDDEYPSHKVVQQQLKTNPKYTCAASFYDPEEALAFIQEHEIDLIFLDIEMPKMNGFQFLEALKKEIYIIILTGYSDRHSQYAHNYYIDKELVFFSNKSQFSYYLPKILVRFEKMYDEKEMLNRINQLSKNEILTFPKNFNNNPILLNDIAQITIIGHNMVLTMKNEEEIVYRMTLRELTQFLPDTFLQIRRNIIINTMYITAFTNTTICLGTRHLPISIRMQKIVVPILKKQKRELYKRLLIKTV